MGKLPHEEWECSECGHKTGDWHVTCPKCRRGHMYAVVREVKPTKPRKKEADEK